MTAIKLTRSHRILVGIVLTGAVVIATIGFVGSYAAVRELAEDKGFGSFAPFFPIGIDAGIVVLLALDLLLTWLRIPFPLLRQSAWLLTAATIAFNAASAWGDPLGVGMHGIIPVLFIITVEAARHAIGRVADITADKHMEGVRFWRWLLAPLPTFRLWRRMKLWELRSYQEVIDMERERLVYQARLRAEYGRMWRRRAPVDERMPLRLARYGVPLRESQGLIAGTTPPPRAEVGPGPAAPASPRTPGALSLPPLWPTAEDERQPTGQQHEQAGQQHGREQHEVAEPATYSVRSAPAAHPTETAAPAESVRERPPAPEAAEVPGPASSDTPPAPHPSAVTVPVTPGGRRRALGNAPANGYPSPVAAAEPLPLPDPAAEPAPEAAPAQEREPAGEPEPVPEPEPVGLPEDMSRAEAFYAAYRQFILEHGGFPNARQLSRFLHERLNVTDADGSLLSEQYLREYIRGFKERYQNEMGMAG